MPKIAFLGDRYSLEFFRLFGLEVFPAETPAEARTILEKLKEQKDVTVFLTEEVFDPVEMKEAFLKGQIVVLPGWKKHQGAGQQLMEELVRKATGLK
ncbi:MAG TPA: V-type ATP synthase subunit F [bacterium]|nr:V-type ATP synthase subunit F [bacterium]HOL67511.1 V-type ATP synthase subunit F [bacterium]